jgi:hypothetical protein
MATGLEFPCPAVTRKAFGSEEIPQAHQRMGNLQDCEYLLRRRQMHRHRQSRRQLNVQSIHARRTVRPRAAGTRLVQVGAILPFFTTDLQILASPLRTCLESSRPYAQGARRRRGRCTIGPVS